MTSIRYLLKDRYRILRAYSVLHETGKSITSYFNKNKVADVSLFKNYVLFICNPFREILYKNVISAALI